MDYDEFEKNEGKATSVPVTPCCDRRLPAHYQRISHDGHLGAVEDEWEESFSIRDPHKRDYFGFRLDRKVL